MKNRLYICFFLIYYLSFETIFKMELEPPMVHFTIKNLDSTVDIRSVINITDATREMIQSVVEEFPHYTHPLYKANTQRCGKIYIPPEQDKMSCIHCCHHMLCKRSWAECNNCRKYAKETIAMIKSIYQATNTSEDEAVIYCKLCMDRSMAPNKYYMDGDFTILSILLPYWDATYSLFLNHITDELIKSHVNPGMNAHTFAIQLTLPCRGYPERVRRMEKMYNELWPVYNISERMITKTIYENHLRDKIVVRDAIMMYLRSMFPNITENILEEHYLDVMSTDMEYVEDPSQNPVHREVHLFARVHLRKITYALIYMRCHGELNRVSTRMLLESGQIPGTGSASSSAS
jgi:hypothetical protein